MSKPWTDDKAFDSAPGSREGLGFSEAWVTGMLELYGSVGERNLGFGRLEAWVTGKLESRGSMDEREAWLLGNFNLHKELGVRVDHGLMLSHA